MKAFLTSPHLALLAQALIYPDNVRYRAAQANPDDCEAPPSTPGIQAALAAVDLMEEFSLGIYHRREAALTLTSAAQSVCDNVQWDVGESADYWRTRLPDKDYTAEMIEENFKYFEAHATAADKFADALRSAGAQYFQAVQSIESK